MEREIRNTASVDVLVKNFDRFEMLKHSTVLPAAFTEQGLYMLSTILKSDQATETSIAIIDTFAMVRQMARVMEQLQNATEVEKCSRICFRRRE